MKDADVAPVVSLAAWLVSNHDRLDFTLSTPKPHLKVTSENRIYNLTLARRFVRMEPLLLSLNSVSMRLIRNSVVEIL